MMKICMNASYAHSVIDIFGSKIVKERTKKGRNFVNLELKIGRSRKCANLVFKIVDS